MHQRLAALVQEHWDAGKSATFWACSTLEELDKLDAPARTRAVESLVVQLHRVLLLGLWPSQQLIAYAWHALSIQMLPATPFLALLTGSLETELFASVGDGAPGPPNGDCSLPRLKALATLAAAAVPLTVAQRDAASVADATHTPRAVVRLLMLACRGVASRVNLGEKDEASAQPIVAVCTRLLDCASSGPVALYVLHVVARAAPDEWGRLRGAMSAVESAGCGQRLPRALRDVCSEVDATLGHTGRANSHRSLTSGLTRATCRWLLADTFAPMALAAPRRLPCGGCAPLVAAKARALVPLPTTTTAHQTHRAQSLKRYGMDGLCEPAAAPRSTLRSALRATLGSGVAHGALPPNYASSMQALRQQASVLSVLRSAT